jgi:ankyrin repeat protein
MTNSSKLILILAPTILICLSGAFSWRYMQKTSKEELIIAVQEGDIKKVRTLLNQSNLKVDTLIDDDATLLMKALNNRYDDLALLLIDKGANVNAMSIGEYTSVLTIACSPAKTITTDLGNGIRKFKVQNLRANPDLVNLLIKRGAKVNPVNGVPPLMVAVMGEESEVVKILIDHGADVNFMLGIQGEGGYSILQRAKASKNNVIIEMLVNAGAS